jgi:3-oxoacyl-[acyl-carrier-protein] synthase II
MNNKRRVVVTGLGIVSSVGIGKDAFWEAITNGKSGISRISSFDTKDFRCHYGGEVKDFNPEEIGKSRRAIEANCRLKKRNSSKLKGRP